MKKKRLDIMLMKVLQGDMGKVANGDDSPVTRTLALANFLKNEGDEAGAKYVVNTMVSIYKEHSPAMYEAVKHLEEADA